ncbi:MAG: AraC family transcriptional regulator ligand-binding domain-containing protein, partial [Pseudomonadota bacterium]|nr:AraC family transcriptional regulator ligand-binding domain-containing protein [Pseudomonadota bacterium]
MTSSMSCSSAYAKLFLRYSQIPAEELLESTPLTLEDLEQQPFIDAEYHRAIIHSLNQRMEDEAWAARSGGRFSINAHGPIGFAAMSAPTLGEALQVMVDFHDIRTNTFGAALDRRVTESTEGSERCRYRMWDLTDDVDYSRVLTESTIKILQSLIQAILGRDAIENFEVHFAWPAPAYCNELEKIYAAPCVFDSKFCGFEMSADLLALRSSTYDETTYRNNLSQCHGLLEELQLSQSSATRV